MNITQSTELNRKWIKKFRLAYKDYLVKIGKNYFHEGKLVQINVHNKAPTGNLIYEVYNKHYPLKRGILLDNTEISIDIFDDGSVYITNLDELVRKLYQDETWRDFFDSVMIKDKMKFYKQLIAKGEINRKGSDNGSYTIQDVDELGDIVQRSKNNGQRIKRSRKKFVRKHQQKVWERHGANGSAHR